MEFPGLNVNDKNPVLTFLDSSSFLFSIMSIKKNQTELLFQ